MRGALGIGLLALSLFLFSPFSYAQTTGSTQTAGQTQIQGCVRQASAEDVANIKKLNGSVIPVGACLDKTMTQTLGLDTGAVEALKYLESKVCAGMNVGYNSSIDPRVLKEKYVYFSADRHGMDTKFMVCAARFIQAAEAITKTPICIRAALRSQEHQRASCMDPANTTVCGRTQRSPIQCRSDFSTCPHVNGRGMDLNSAQIDRVAALANSGSYGVKMGVNNAYDPWHLEPNGAACTGTVSSPGPIDQPYQPGTSYQQNGYVQSPNMPYAPAIQQALNPQTSQPARPSLPSIPNTPASPGTTPLSGFSPIVNPVLNPIGTASSSTSTRSVADMLSDLAFGTVASSSGIATTLPIVINSFINPGNVRIESTTTAAGPTSTDGYAWAPPSIPVPQTFVSPDLADPETGSADVQATLVQLYTALRDTLLRILQFLRPFSISNTIEAQQQQDLFGL